MNGSGFQSGDDISINPGGVTLTYSSLTVKTSTTLAGETHLDKPGNYTVQVVGSNPLTLVVQELTPVVTGVTTTPSLPVAHQPFTIAVAGLNFNPKSVSISVSGPGCVPYCPASPMTKATETLLTASLTLHEFGTYSLSTMNTAVVSNAVTFMVQAATPSISSVSTSPAVPFASQPFTIGLIGSDFDPTNVRLVLNGPGCAPCIVPNSALTSKSAHSVEGTATIASAGQFTVAAQNGAGGTVSPAFVLPLVIAAATAPVITAVNAPATIRALQDFSLEIVGTGFDPAFARIMISGPRCSPCEWDAGYFSEKSATRLKALIMLSVEGAFSVWVQNAIGTAASNTKTLTVLPALPAITRLTVNPNPPSAGSSFRLTVEGFGFDPQIVRMVVTGPECAPCLIEPPAMSPKSSTSLSTFLKLASGGIFSVALQNGSAGPLSNALSFTVSSVAAPALSGVATNPASVTAGQSFVLTVTGTGFDPATAQMVVSGPGCGPCIIVNSALTTRTATLLSGPLTLTNAGTFTVAMRNGSGALTDNLPLTVRSLAISISSASTSPSPPTVLQAFVLTLTGTGFDPAIVQVVVRGPSCDPCMFDNSALTTRTATAVSGQLVVATAGDYTVTARNGIGGTLSNAVSIAVRASITGIATAPDPVIAGQQFVLRVNGSGFDPATAQILVSGQGCAPCTIANGALTAKSALTLSGTIRLDTEGAYLVTVRHGSGGPLSNEVGLAVFSSALTVTAVETYPSPAVAGRPFILTLTGRNFDPATAEVQVTGPACNPCVLANIALTTKTSTMLSGPLTLAAGAYSARAQNGAVSFSNAISFTVGDTAPQVGSIVSAAGFQPFLARGGVSSLFGKDLAETTVEAGPTPLPKTLAGVSVWVGGREAPLWFVSPTQINFQIPFESPLSGRIPVVVARKGVSSEPVEIVLSAYAPGIFQYRNAGGEVAPIVTHLDGALVDAEHPAAPGEYVVAWGTGLGDLTVIPLSGEASPSSPPAMSRMTPEVTLGGAPIEVSFSGLAAGGVGLAQFNLRLPETLPAGTADLIIRFGEASSTPVRLVVGNPGSRD